MFFSDMRIAIGIEYDGTAYNGWQRQRTGSRRAAGARTCPRRGCRRNCRSHLRRPYRYGRSCHRAGGALRHDGGTQRPRLVARCEHEPSGRRQRELGKASRTEFHARFSATARSYRYRILNRLVRSALESPAGMVGLPAPRSRAHARPQHRHSWESTIFLRFGRPDARRRRPVREDHLDQRAA